MNNTPPNAPDEKTNAAPKKRSIIKIVLLILWLMIAITWFYFIATWQ